MGTDILSWVEVREPETNRWAAVENAFQCEAWEKECGEKDFSSEPFRRTHYALFGFLADVRNYARCEPLDKPRGLPEGFDPRGPVLAGAADEREDWDLSDFHDHSWFLLSELLRFDYEKVFRNLRIENGMTRAEVGEGRLQSYRELLSPYYFDVLETMKGLGDPDRVRVVFCFGS